MSKYLAIKKIITCGVQVVLKWQDNEYIHQTMAEQQLRIKNNSAVLNLYENYPSFFW